MERKWSPSRSPGTAPNGLRPGGQHARKQQNNKETAKGEVQEGEVQKVKCKVRQHASDEAQHASGPSGPVRILGRPGGMCGASGGL